VTETTAAPVEPTVPCTVTDVAGHVPVVLNDFIGATTVSVKSDDQEYRLRGAGTREGLAVEFYDKEPASADAEPTVWTITEQGDGSMVAEPPAS
jgi:hypothetical protein